MVYEVDDFDNVGCCLSYEGFFGIGLCWVLSGGEFVVDCGCDGVELCWVVDFDCELGDDVV